MYKRMLTGVLCCQISLAAVGCHSELELRPVGPQVGLCQEIFSQKINKNFDGVNLHLPREKLLSVILSHLDSVEQHIFQNAGRIGGREANVSGQIERIKILQKIEDGFHKANICGTHDGSADMYIFADELRSFLAKRGVDVANLFGEGEQGISETEYPLTLVLISLARA